MQLHINTPLLNSRPLSDILGSHVWLKMEAMQPSGSFKIRGIGLACQTYYEKGARRFISSSGGNAGLAVAYAGRMLGVRVTVVVPQTTSARAKALLLLEKAEVIIHGASWQEAHAHALSLMGEQDAFLHPFDDPLLWQGHATMIDEVVSSGVRPDAVVVSVGGGGLLCGVIEGLRRNNLHDIPVIAMETEGAASFHASVTAGKVVDITQIATVATSLGAKRVCEQSMKYAGSHPVISEVVTDDEAVHACRQFTDDHRVLTEPACGASLACLYEKKAVIRPFSSPLVIVCGGATLSLEALTALCNK
ncbi:pyridoxal-phosphate dependent enzyme [Photorhabdus sp. CRCIA-P01]|uniref:pyridoxal-phosphate dependent enzyme n=1 Tax=Photorhabdus sp. CRCIA-P01 TaxID=2019570 RepID=UPI000E59FA58|nr:pyridoxal-phosphate dependent enzyme [Photorhabdus sp. CRCIA-P01]